MATAQVSGVNPLMESQNQPGCLGSRCSPCGARKAAPVQQVHAVPLYPEMNQMTVQTRTYAAPATARPAMEMAPSMPAMSPLPPMQTQAPTTANISSPNLSVIPNAYATPRVVGGTTMVSAPPPATVVSKDVAALDTAVPVPQQQVREVVGAKAAPPAPPAPAMVGQQQPPPPPVMHMMMMQLPPSQRRPDMMNFMMQYAQTKTEVQTCMQLINKLSQELEMLKKSNADLQRQIDEHERELHPERFESRPAARGGGAGGVLSGVQGGDASDPIDVYLNDFVNNHPDINLKISKVDPPMYLLNGQEAFITEKDGVVVIRDGVEWKSFIDFIAEATAPPPAETEEAPPAPKPKAKTKVAAAKPGAKTKAAAGAGAKAKPKAGAAKAKPKAKAK
ncbi:unnamed protein product [Vitrella brassicaformis CCMP3155]|uniref:GAR domain-containing protein n=1 Tax=Vitrella brassicaformis (strain CCMP3155) TaxID=1169540 RepID=A0A0G4EIY0_VITBC|nr:unnamed protein product [Vitrella brassicaformis CCMP3155]|mmetsp:Transcript_36098/g.90058  ORF Transcript_36098/g.90058 Transcript_36098/m.90058 type:complete len:391 (-) Transcript_36098:341-1513(-)|eukprot:CEL96656.1 unnamed protein product [Vitrella brassicaformis CCMP3155]